MEENANKEPLLARIQQLEKERDELRKDIEQLCMQQAGPGYIAAATRMHFQRTAGLEQEIEDLKKKSDAYTRENYNLREELSEAYRIKSQLADLHNAEVAKNVEAEKQVKFFQGCVAAAFAERDQSIMEAEKAVEKEEILSHELIVVQKRLEELNSDFLKLEEANGALRLGLVKQEELNKTFKMVINKFYEIKQPAFEGVEESSWEDKCRCLLDDPKEMWSYNDASTAEYINALERELQNVRNSHDNIQNKFRMGLEIENHMKRRITELEKKLILAGKTIKDGLARLRSYHSEYKKAIVDLLEEGKSSLKSSMGTIDEKLREFGESNVSLVGQNDILGTRENGFEEEHQPLPAMPDSITKTDDKLEYNSKGNVSEVLAQALKEKVDALLQLSQQEERCLLERNVNLALQKKVEELQRNLLQVTNEKVKVLMELAQLKQEHQLFMEKSSREIRQGIGANTQETKHVTQERDGTLRNLLKKTYLRHWVGQVDVSGHNADFEKANGSPVFSRRSNSMDFARMKIENATLKEGMEIIEHLISSVHRLRLSLLKVKESYSSEGTSIGVPQILDDVIAEAKLVKTALGSSLPVSWSAESSTSSTGESSAEEPNISECSGEKIDAISAAGFEMVELLIFAAQVMKDNTTKGGFKGSN